MGQLIYLEHIKIEQEKKIRSEVLKQFPWQEIVSINQYFIAPMVELWGEPKQVIVKEAVFRLVFEAFILGVKARIRRSSKQWEEDQEVSQLVQDVMDAFSMFRVFPYRKRTSLRMLFTSIAEEWYIRGVRSTVAVN